MAHQVLFPATGLTVYDEFGNLVPSTGIGPVDTSSAYYAEQMRQGRLGTVDPLSVNHPPAPGVYAPVTLGLVTTQLAGYAIQRDTQYVTTSGYATPGDGGGMTFQGALGVSAGADGYIKINANNGQWRALTPSQLGYMDPRWFGARWDDTTGVDDTDAINLAITTAVAAGLKSTYLPAGTALICSSTAQDGVICPIGHRLFGSGSITTKLRVGANASDGNGNFGFDTGARYAVYIAGAYTDAEGFGITVDNADLVDPRSPLPLANQRHGLLYQGYAASLRLIDVYGVSGAGFRGLGSSFQVAIFGIVTSNTGNHGIWLTGNNTWIVEHCSAAAVPDGHSGLKIDGGQAFVSVFNSLFTNYFYGGLPSRWDPVTNPTGWREQLTNCAEISADCVFVACNFEEFTGCGIKVGSPRAPVLLGCTFYSYKGGSIGAGGCRGVEATFINTPVDLNGSNNFFPPSYGGWGDPATGVLDGCAFSCRGSSLPPFTYPYKDFGPIYSYGSSAALTIYAQSFLQVGNVQLATRFPSVHIDKAQFPRTAITAAGNIGFGHSLCDVSAAGYTVHLPSPVTDSGDECVVSIMKGANTLTVDAVSGYPIFDGTGGAALTWAITGLHKSVTFRRGKGQYLGSTFDGWVISAKNY